MVAADTTNIHRILPKNGSTIIEEPKVEGTNTDLELSDPRMNAENIKFQLETKAQHIQFLKQKLSHIKNVTDQQGDDLHKYNKEKNHDYSNHTYGEDTVIL